MSARVTRPLPVAEPSLARENLSLDGMKPNASFQPRSQAAGRLVRRGDLRVGPWTIPTPCVWLGTLPRTGPDLWRVIRRPNLIASVASLGPEFLSGKGRPRNDEKWRALRERAPLLLDSGAFSLLRNGVTTLTPSRVMRGYRYLRPELGVVLDVPLSPEDSERCQAQKWRRTLANTTWMSENDGFVNLVPVVHGYTQASLRRACQDIREIAVPPVVGLGSVVPLLKRGLLRKRMVDEWGTTGGYLASAVQTVRESFPESMVHVFGVGSVHTIRRLLSAGADSVDSSSWRIKAAHGAVLVPGGYDRFVSPQAGRKGLTAEDSDRLAGCQCPICEEKPLKMRLRLLDNAEAGTFGNRAVHNAWVVRDVVAQFRYAIREGMATS